MLERAIDAQRRERDARLMTGDVVAATMAHELKQPLTAMITRSYAGLRCLERAAPELDKATAGFRQIADDGHRAAAVIDRIRASFRSDARVRTPLDINTLIQEAIALLQDDLTSHRISVKVEPTQPLLPVMGDRIQLQEVLLNLITNAIEGMAAVDDPRVLAVSSDVQADGGVRVAIADTGTGINAEDVPLVFNPLYTTKAGGMGMGLSICRSIIEAHEGKLWVVPNIPRGSVFHFVLGGGTPTAVGGV
jgi:signal transduction histidine kinase